MSATRPLAFCHTAIGATSRKRRNVFTPSPPILRGSVASSHLSSGIVVPASQSHPLRISAS
eukprot:296003-Prorocentrum_lima.AAC.1